MLGGAPTVKLCFSVPLMEKMLTPISRSIV